jgi:hypothetical protein
MIEILLEDILNKIHLKNFSDPKQISEELGRLIIRDFLTQDQFAYCSSKIFNSELNLFAFLNDNASEKDKHITNLRKEVLDIICDYIQIAKYHLVNYLAFIRDSTLAIFKKDSSLVVKEAALKIIVKLLQSFEPQVLAPVIQVEALAHMMLDEIKFLKPKPSVRGRIWQILGELIRKFPLLMQSLIFEIQEVSFFSIKSMMETGEGVELKTLRGLLQLTRANLEVSTYPDEERRL